MATKNILGHHKDWQLDLFLVINPMATKKTFSHQFCGDRKNIQLLQEKKIQSPILCQSKKVLVTIQ
jgi:hypothetical protein